MSVNLRIMIDVEHIENFDNPGMIQSFVNFDFPQSMPWIDARG